MSKFVIIGNASVVPEDIKAMFQNNNMNELIIHLKEEDRKMIVEEVTIEEATQIINDYFKEQVSDQADSLKYFFEGLDRVIDSGSLSHMFGKEEVPGPKPVTVEDYLKTDPVTMAVDKCNRIFASNSLTKDLFVDKVGTPADGTNVPYGRRDGKLYTVSTLKTIEKLEEDQEGN